MKGIALAKVKPKTIRVLVTEKNDGEALLSRFVKIPYYCEKSSGFIVGRIVDFEYNNPFYQKEDMSMELKKYANNFDLIKKIVEDKSALVLDISLISAFNEKSERIELTCPVQLAVDVETLKDEDLLTIFKQQQFNFSYLGNFLGTNVVAPFDLKDFKQLGEAFHFLVVGQTGSGKSTLVQMLLLLYAQKNKEMNFIIFDTVGEFSNLFRGNYQGGFWQGKFLDLYKNIRTNINIYSVSEDIALDNWNTLRELLILNNVFEPIGVPNTSKNNIEQGVNFLIHRFQKKYSIEHLFDNINDIIKSLLFERDKLVEAIYKSQEAKERVLNIMQSSSQWDSFKTNLENIFKLFSQRSRKSLSSIIHSLQKEKGQTIVIDLSKFANMNAEEIFYLKRLILKELVNKLTIEGEKAWINNDNMNTLVVLEEAHNWVPARVSTDISEDSYTQELSDMLVKAYRETRKFGIGWLAISTRPSALRKEVFEHSRVKWIGMGINTGSDYYLLKDSFGEDFQNIYRLFPDPTDPLSKTRKVCFMVQGPVTILSRTDADYIDMFNNIDDFIKYNNLRL